MARSTEPDLTGRLRRGQLVPSRVPLWVLENPFQFATAGLSVVLGGGVATTQLDHLQPFTRVQADLPPLLALAWGLLMLVGGIVTLTAMHHRDRAPRKYEPMESAGLAVLGSAWAVFAVAPAFAAGAYSATVIGSLVGIACLLRIVAISVSHRVAREASALHREVQ